MSERVEIDRKSTTVRFPSDMFKKVKIRCVMEDMSINEYMVELVKKDMKEWSKKNRTVPV